MHTIAVWGSALLLVILVFAVIILLTIGLVNR
jgi:hypothetical protein